MQACFQLCASPPPARATKPATKATTLQAVQLGKLNLDSGIILAPMAGVTNAPFRKLCSEYGAKLTISEMLHASLYLSNRVSPTFHAHETRSVQLYGTDADTLSAAAMRLVQEDGVEHIDLNFGCPAPKILRRGGGAAVPGDSRRFEGILKSVVGATGDVGVTCKLRAGYGGRSTYMTAGRIAEACGVSGVTLHARTAEELYDRGAGRAAWGRIGELVEGIGIPVFGNGDVFTAGDAVDMRYLTGCAGVVVGRGCLGRPWLFADIAEAFCGGGGGGGGVTVPGVDVVLGVMKRLVGEIVEELMMRGVPEARAVRSVRKWYGWFLQGYGCGDLVAELVNAVEFDRIERVIDSFRGVVDIDIGQVVKERGKLGRE